MRPAGVLLSVLLLLISFLPSTTASPVKTIRGARSYVELSTSLPLRVLKENDDKSKDIPDDIYHCLDPNEVWKEFDKTVECDWDTHEWNLDKLDPDLIPEHCSQWGWVFGGVLADLQDWEEPCYLWTTLYGSMNVTTDDPTFSPSTPPTPGPSIGTAVPTYVPTESPTVETSFLDTTSTPRATQATLEPSSEASYSEPTHDPTAKPTARPTRRPTARPTVKGTSAQPTADPSSTEPTAILLSEHHEFNHEYQPIDITPGPSAPPTEASPTAFPTAVTKSHIYDVSTMVMTFHLNPVSRKHMDREILEEVTARHIQKEMKRSLTFWLEQKELDVEAKEPLAVDVKLILTNVRAFVLPNETMVATEAISGTVTLEGPPVRWPESIKSEVEASFEGAALHRYLAQLRLSTDPVLQGTDSIEVGLPLDLLGSSTYDSDAAPSMLTGSDSTAVFTVAGVEFSLTTLAIIAGSIAIFSILLLICVCWKLYRIRKHQFQELHQSLPKNTKPSHSTEEECSFTPPSAKKPKRSVPSAQTTKTKHKRGSSSTKNEEEASSSPSASSEVIDETDPNNNRYYQRYIAETDDRSLATSTYSYLDSNLQRDAGGISLAPSYLYGNDDASLQSKALWSLIDGINAQDEDYNYHQTASPSNPGNRTNTNLSTPELKLMTSPSNMMITTADKPSPYIDGNNLEDDNFSLTSLGVGASYQDRIALAMTGGKTKVSQPLDATPNSQENNPTNPFEEETEARIAARMGVSARKKKASVGRGGSNGSVRKVLGQLAACGTSQYNRGYEDEEELLPAPSDEYRGRSTNASRSDQSGENVAIQVANDRVTLLGDSSLNTSSRNSSLLPDNLFPDDNLLCDVSDMSKDRTNSPVGVNTSTLLKGGTDGNCTIDTIASF